MNPKFCPKCGERGTCRQTRHTDESVRRRYVCNTPGCGEKWTSYEVLLTDEDLKKYG